MKIVQMDFVRIPEEIFLQILAFLDVKDLLSCCMVSRNWRETINKDWLWKHICNRGSETKKIILYLANEEKSATQLGVEDTFSVSESALQPPCKWRLNYMRYTQIINKIQIGNNCVYKIPYHPVHCSAFKIIDCYVLFLNDLKNLIEIWNIKNEPYQQDIIKYSLQCLPIKMVEIVDDFLVVLQCNLLQVYKNNVSTFVLLYRRLFNLPQESSECMPQLSDITDWYNEKIKFKTDYLSARYIVCGDYFVGSLVDSDSHCPLVIHIWNIKTGDKVKELEVPFSQGILHGSDIYFHSNKKNLFIILTCTDGLIKYNRIIEYNLKEYKFSNLNVKTSYFPKSTLNTFIGQYLLGCRTDLRFLIPGVIFKDTFVITLGPLWKTLIIWEAETGIKLAETSFDYTVLPNTLDIYDSHIGFIEYKFAPKEMNAVIMNYKENCFQTVCSIKINFGVAGLRFLHRSLIVIENFSEVAVWDVKTSCKLYTIDCDFYLNKNHKEFHFHPTPKLQLQIMKLPLWFTCYKILGYPKAESKQDKPLKIHHTDWCKRRFQL